jgi:hypothetical protein
MEAVAANIQLLENPPRLVPRAFNVVKNGFPPLIDINLIAFLVGTDTEAADVLENWGSDLPERFRSIKLTRKQRVHLQRRRLLLRNRRIVSGYELLDNELRRKLGGDGAPDGVPPTWLTVGKWTARTIGDLLDGHIPVPQNQRTARLLVRRLLRVIAQWRTISMGRALVLGNREIFAQVGSALAVFVNMDFDTKKLDFAGFVGQYGRRLIGLNDPDVPDELPISITAATRDPLSDSILRALHAYYRAIDASPELERGKWVQAGNLHLAAYEQRVAQTFVDLGLAARTGLSLKLLLAGPPPERAPESAALGPRPRDMLLEPGFVVRAVDLAAAAFATRYIVALAVGRPAGPQRAPLVFAPADSLDLRGTEIRDYARTVVYKKYEEDEKREKDAAGHALRRIWISLDRADGVSNRCRVRDWRTYAARINYIANLFLVSAFEQRFAEPVFDEVELRSFLSGRLTDEEEIELTNEQAVEVARLRAQPHTSRGFSAPAE